MKKANFNRSEIAKSAHAFKAQGFTWADAMRKAWHDAKIQAIFKALESGEATFAFLKSDGSERVARGTCNLNLIPKESHPKGTGTASPAVKPFWDLDISDWRCFKLLSLQRVLSL